MRKLYVARCIFCLEMTFRNYLGIVFEQLSGNDLSYKIRLRHEVGSQNTWDTDRVGPAFQLPGPRAQALR